MNFLNSLIDQSAELIKTQNWLSFVLSSAGIIVAGILVHVIVFYLLKVYGRKTGKDMFLKGRMYLRKSSMVLLLSIALDIIVTAYSDGQEVFNILDHVFIIFIIASIAWMLIRLVGLGKEIILARYDMGEKDNLRARKIITQFNIIERIIIFILVLIALAVALMTFESIKKLGVSLFASAGVAGIILGFAAQKLIGTVLAGIQIAITQPITLDDVVIVEDEWGRIEEITLTYVVVRIWDRRRLIVPTTYFIEKPFQNWTRVSSDIIGSVYLRTDYNVPVDDLRKELKRILETEEKWDKEVQVLQVTDISEKTMELRALMTAADSSSAWDLRVSVRERLMKYIQEKYPGSLPRTRIDLEKEGSDSKSKTNK